MIAFAGAMLALGLAGLAQESPAKAQDRMIAYLLASQNADGSWGSARNALPIDLFGWNEGNHLLAQRATSALCCLALLENASRSDEEAALRRGIDFLLAGEPSKRPSTWEVYNVWSYCYALQLFARAHGDPRFAEGPLAPKLRAAAENEIATLARYQSPAGGWGYYDFWTYAQRPSWATSFTTGSILIALQDAQVEGFSIPEKMIERAVKALRRCRLPSGAYTYSVNEIPGPGGLEWIDQIKGSLSRIQVGNVGLFRASAGVTTADLQRGLEMFFQHHKFLDVARRRPWPHEAYYLNSGYFYFYGHHYAAMAIERLPAKDRARYWPKLQEAIVPCLERDGAVWDWMMNDYAKPYATAFAAMALGRSLKNNGDGLPARSIPN